MGRITENWDAFTYQKGKSARRQFLATGFADGESARSACPIQRGDELWLDGNLIAEEPAVSTPKGPQNFVLDVNYSANSGETADVSLLKTPPVYLPDLTLSTEPIDRDIYGNPITNSALDPFQQNVSKQFVDIHYTYKRYELKYNGPFALNFMGKVNDDEFNMPGFGTVSEGQALCLRIAPSAEYDRNAKAVQIIYSFHIREDGFKTRILDKGRRGFFQDGTDTIYAKNSDGKAGDPVANDVLLLDGVPFNQDEYVIGKDAQAPFKSNELPDKVEQTVEDGAVFLHYEIYEKVSFQSLNLLP
jgi:hypothetical protein